MRASPGASRPSTRRATAGRPRDQRIDRAVIAATIDATADNGYHDISINQIANVAGTTRAAINRRWPTKAHLVLEAFMTHTAAFPTPDTGSLRTDLEALTGQHIELCTQPPHRGIVIAALAARGELGHGFDGITQARQASIDAIFDRARTGGDLPPDTDPAFITQLLAGTTLYRTVILNQPVDYDYVVELVNRALPPHHPFMKPPATTGA